jgi:hypothetical protein
MLPSEPIVNPIDTRQPLRRPVAAKVTTPGIVFHGVVMLAKKERFEIRRAAQRSAPQLRTSSSAAWLFVTRCD